MKRRIRCPICKHYEFPSSDHIPPKSCGNTNDVINTYLFPTELGYERRKISQGGLHFEFICSQCNNRLGAKPDKALASLYKTVINSRDEIIVWEGDIKSVIKSVFGHILAAGPYSPSSYDKEMRDFINKDVIPLKTHLFLLYYPYRYVFTIKTALPIIHFKRCIPMKRLKLDIFSCLYFYPLAFIAGEPGSISLGVDLMNVLKQGGREAHLSVHSFKNIITGKYLPPCWPCGIGDSQNPDTMDAIASGKEATNAALSSVKKKK